LVLALRAGRDEAGVLVVGCDRSLLSVPERVGLLGLVVGFESPGADFEANLGLLPTDMGLLRPGAGLLVADVGLLGTCAALESPPAGLLVLLAMVEVGGLSGPGIVDAGPKLNDGPNENDWA